MKAIPKRERKFQTNNDTEKSDLTLINKFGALPALRPVAHKI
jgi:hypothetical protein